jgi:hypothetical protein
MLLKHARVADSDFRELVESGHLVVGEIGKAAPNATTHHFNGDDDDGSHLVIINSGLINFLQATAQCLFRAATVYLGDGKVIDPTGDINDVVARLTELFRFWKSKPSDYDEVFIFQSIDMPQQVKEDSELLARMLVEFILSHELGHVRYSHNPSGESTKISDQEFDADATGAFLAITSGQYDNSQRLSYAGAVVALRVLAVLESLGHVFPGSHPPPLDRLMAMKKSVEVKVGDPVDYVYLSTIAIAFDEQLEEASIRAQGRCEGAPLTVERIVSRLYAALEECCKGTITDYVPKKLFLDDIRDAPLEMLPELAVRTTRLFAPNLTKPRRLQPRMQELFKSFLPELPEPARTIFLDHNNPNQKET